MAGYPAGRGRRRHARAALAIGCTATTRQIWRRSASAGSVAETTCRTSCSCPVRSGRSRDRHRWRAVSRRPRTRSELGHVTVDPMGPACSCGGRGCLERVAGQERCLKPQGCLQRREPPSAALSHQWQSSYAERSQVSRRHFSRWRRPELRSVSRFLPSSMSWIFDCRARRFYAELAPWLIDL